MAKKISKNKLTIITMPDCCGNCLYFHPTNVQNSFCFCGSAEANKHYCLKNLSEHTYCRFFSTRKCKCASCHAFMESTDVMFKITSKIFEEYKDFSAIYRSPSYCGKCLPKELLSYKERTNKHEVMITVVQADNGRLDESITKR